MACCTKSVQCATSICLILLSVFIVLGCFYRFLQAWKEERFLPSALEPVLWNHGRCWGGKWRWQRYILFCCSVLLAHSPPELFTLQCGNHFHWGYCKTRHLLFQFPVTVVLIIRIVVLKLTQMRCLFPWQLCTLSEFTAAVLTVLCCSCFMEEVTLHCRGQCSRWDYYGVSAHSELPLNLCEEYVNLTFFQSQHILSTRLLKCLLWGFGFQTVICSRINCRVVAMDLRAHGEHFIWLCCS